MEVISPDDVNRFLDRHLNTRPERTELRQLRRLSAPIIFDHSDPAVNEARRRLILEYCLDIGAASVQRYPYGAHERFAASEKALLLELADTLRPAA